MLHHLRKGRRKDSALLNFDFLDVRFESRDLAALVALADDQGEGEAAVDDGNVERGVKLDCEGVGSRIQVVRGGDEDLGVLGIEGDEVGSSGVGGGNLEVVSKGEVARSSLLWNGNDEGVGADLVGLVSDCVGRVVEFFVKSCKTVEYNTINKVSTDF